MGDEIISGPSQSPSQSKSTPQKRKYEAIGSDARKIILNVLECCDEEKKSRRLLHMLSQSVKRAATYCGTCTRTVGRIKKYAKAHPGETPKTPGRRRPKTKGRAQLDEFGRGIVRHTVEDFYLVQKEVPSLRKLLPVLKEKAIWNWGISSFRKVVLPMGFTYKKILNKRTVLLECADIVDKRYHFLVQMKQSRIAYSEIFYLDEWWIDSNLMCGKCWQRDNVSSVIAAGSASQKLIIGNIGSRKGFVSEAKLQFWADSVEGDCHGQMNTTNFEKWFNDKVLPQLPPQSTIVMESAPYHNRQVDKTPSRYDTKESMVEWLERREIPCNENMRKETLYALIRANKISEKPYVIDTLAKQHGHMVLRLPPFNYDLNAMELAYRKVKEKLKEQNVEGEMSCENLLKVADDSLLSVTEDDWKGYCKKVQELEGDYWLRDKDVETAVDKIIFNSNAYDSDENQDSETDESYSDSD